MAGQSRNYGGGSHQRQQYTPSLDVSKVVFSGDLEPELFSSVAEQTARTIASGKNTNKSTQLRKFYDEICMWETRISSHPEMFKESLPFIKMINAKVAYAKGRKLVDDNYVLLINHCLKQIQDEDTMRYFKLFMEAFMGFYKVERPRD
ncbi:MAG: CRISPR-associated protein, Csm2 family [uncultured Thiotrichaceae bacterium]|uniref:CRISPR system Cms protein Csm2 n=1 Tax=uncultured Thiotrichaceae bacterium TaxID=298394 RepID=A0A6S6TLY7_9GAMM|nr:MAG: CRISPR-associated protein, Csm2 family [uncultured Thiotrichaceae bacterium]